MGVCVLLCGIAEVHRHVLNLHRCFVKQHEIFIKRLAQQPASFSGLIHKVKLLMLRTPAFNLKANKQAEPLFLFLSGARE